VNKDQKSIVLEYSSTLSDDSLRLLVLRLSEKFSGDIAEALNEMSIDKKMDALLASTESAEGLFVMLDHIRDVLQKECKRKGLLLKLSTSVA
jgi:hypothetical protein